MEKNKMLTAKQMLAVIKEAKAENINAGELSLETIQKVIKHLSLRSVDGMEKDIDGAVTFFVYAFPKGNVYAKNAGYFYLRFSPLEYTKEIVLSKLYDLMEHLHSWWIGTSKKPFVLMGESGEKEWAEK